MANTTWNPSDKTAGITLTGSNLVATSGAGNHFVRSTDRLITGKFYFEITATNWQTTTSGIGIANPGAPFAINFTGACVVNGSGGAIVVNNVPAGATLGARASGDIIGFAVDLTNQLFWCRAAPAGNWNGIAGAAPGGTGGINFGLIGGAGLPVCAFGFTAASGIVYTANFGDTAFSGAVPAGFTSGFTAGASIPTNALATQVAVEHWGTVADVVFVANVSVMVLA